MTDHPAGIERMPRDGESDWEKSLLRIGAEQTVSQQVGVFRDTQYLIGLEDSPAVQAPDVMPQVFRRG